MTFVSIDPELLLPDTPSPAPTHPGQSKDWEHACPECGAKVQWGCTKPSGGTLRDGDGGGLAHHQRRILWDIPF